MQQRNGTELSCLYTKHKTQKRKVWNDGRLVVLQSCARLHDANPVPGSSDPVLDQCELSKDQRQVLLEKRDMMLECEKFLIEVEGVWRPPCPFTSPTKSTAPNMSSLLKKKFKMPPPYMPSSSNSQQGTRTPMLGKRKRPLQPGELAQMHRREAARHQQNLTPQQKTSTNQFGRENYDTNIAMHTNSRKFHLENHDFLRSSLQDDFRTQRNQHAKDARSSKNISKSISIPRFLQANFVSADSSGQPEHEAEPITSNRSPGMDYDVERNQNTLQRNEFDAESFYGHEAEVEDNEEYISTERIRISSRNNDTTDSSMSDFCPPDRESLPSDPIALKVPKQDDPYSDDAFLEMFGAVPADPCAREARQESHVSEQRKCGRTKFVLPSQSSSEDES